jgi:alkylation response protein AidB-like acyl-CoA dehydrogenase
MKVPDTEALLQSVEDLRGEVAAVREDVDRLRRLPDPIAKALAERNFYGVLLPRELGGLGVDPITYLRMVEAFSAMDGSVGWNFAIGAGSSLLAGFVAEPVAREIFSGPNALPERPLRPESRGSSTAATA